MKPNISARVMADESKSQGGAAAAAASEAPGKVSFTIKTLEQSVPLQIKDQLHHNNTMNYLKHFPPFHFLYYFVYLELQ